MLKKKLQEQFFLVRRAESKFSNVTFKIRRKDGELVWHSINCKPILNNEGNAIGYRGDGQDITERVFREKEIKEKNEYLELAERTAKLGNWIIDFENSKVTWSNETKRIHEVPLDYEPILETGINFYAPEVRQKVQDLVAKSIETGEGWEFELPLITAKGNRIWVHANADVIRKNDRTKKIFGIFQDISESKKIQSERDNIFNMSLDFISITGPDGYFKELNSAWHDTLEYSIDELLKRPIWDFIHPEDIEKTQKSFINVMLDPVIGFENRFVTKSGKVVWFAWNSQSNPEDKLVYSITRNITNQKKQEN